jgi:hypothetical protein
MKHYHDWKVVLYDLDGAPHIAGRMSAVRGLAWFRWLHDWWSRQTLYGASVKLELWRGKHCVISLLIHLLPIAIAGAFPPLLAWLSPGL